MRKNPFNNKLQARDRAIFQPYHQNLTVNDLINITMQAQAQGSKVIEGMIKVANNLFIRNENFDKSEAVKNNIWLPALRAYTEYCYNTLPARDIEAELADNEEMYMDDFLDADADIIEDEIDERNDEKEKKKDRQVNQQDWSYNPYEAKEIHFFLDLFKERLPYVFPS